MWPMSPPAALRRIRRITKQDIERRSVPALGRTIHEEVKNVDQVGGGAVHRSAPLAPAQIERSEQVFEVGHAFTEQVRCRDRDRGGVE